MKHLATYVLLAVLTACSLSYSVGQDCLYNAQLVDGPAVSYLDSESSLMWSDDTLYLGGTYVINGSDAHAFSSRQELVDYLGCHFKIASDFDPHLSGTVHLIQLSETSGPQDVAIISFSAYGRGYTYVLIDQQSTYEMISAIPIVNQPATYYTYGDSSTSSIVYVPEDQISGSLSVVSEAVIDTNPILALTSYAHDSLVISPAVFETSYHYYASETSSCVEAEVVQIDYVYTAVEPYRTILTTSPEYDKVTETYLTQYGYYGDDYYLREPLELDSFQSVYVTDIQVDEVSSSCNKPQLLSCIDVSLVMDSINVVSDLGLVYPPCREGYSSAGPYCYIDDAMIDDTYAIRTYYRQTSPGEVDGMIFHEATLDTITRSVVLNKDVLPSSCLQERIDSIPYLALRTDTQWDLVPVDATYTTVDVYSVQQPPVVEATPSTETPQNLEVIKPLELIYNETLVAVPTYINQCLLNSVGSALVSLDYLDDVHTETELYQAILRHQQDEQLPIGVLSRIYLDALNIDY